MTPISKKPNFSRVFCLCLLAALLLSATPAYTEQVTFQKESIVDVTAFGAKGDGKTDDTEPFRQALDAAGQDGIGGIVFAPRGTYLIEGRLIIPAHVTLQGIWHAPTAWSEYKGTTLLTTAGEGEPDSAPFITLNTNSVLKGLTIYYPNQIVANPPKPYPWTIASAGADNCSIIDVLIVNPYMAVDFGTRPAGRHYIRNLYAQPMLKGLYVDQCYDVGRVENVHFWPFWTCNTPEKKCIEDFIAAHGESFIFGRTDWEYVYNTFSWGYKVGYHFIRTEHGVANGNFLGIGADATNNALLIDDCAPYGLLITNGEFVSFLKPDPVSLVVKPENQGVIQLQNCSFWGPAAQIAHIQGDGTVMFNNCNFVMWDYEGKGLPAVECSRGNLLVSSCNFNRPGHHIELEQGVASAVITGNRFAGVPRITNESEADVQIGLNTGIRLAAEEPNAITIDDSDGEPGFVTEGEWFPGRGGRDYAELCRWAYKGKGESKALWIPQIPEQGLYEVFVWYGRDPFNNHATDAPFTVKWSGGLETFEVNLKENTGQWNKLGEFEFAKGDSGYVMISNDANDNVVADAVKFVPKAGKEEKRGRSLLKKIFFFL